MPLVCRRPVGSGEGIGATMHPGELPKVDYTFNSMADLVKAHQAELAAR
jgi:2-haloacid dehalogenase